MGGEVAETGLVLYLKLEPVNGTLVAVGTGQEA